MRQPSIDLLTEKMESKYALVVATAKRARMLTDGARPMLDRETDEITKAVSVALEEIGEDKIIIDTPQGGIK